MSGRVVGGAQTLSKMRQRFPGSYPRSMVRGRGAHVMADGCWYVDWSCALGAVSLGYGDHVVDEEVKGQVERGPIFSLSNVELEERVAERLCALVPCAEAVKFTKTGSEATEAAVRVARAATGCDVVLTCGYHSWYSWYAATREEHPGVPDWMEPLVQPFQYNDLKSLDLAADCAWSMGDGRPGRAFGSTGAPRGKRSTGLAVRGVAAIILEPTLFEPPAPGFLEGVRERATRLGAVLIFDEMVTGFRWHAGGYQALCGVTPDLATFGKAMGNGYPISALVGRADLMQWARLASGTFGGDCVGLAAADAVLERYSARASDMVSVTDHMWRIGADLIDGYNRIAEKLGAPTRMEGQPPHPVIRWDEEQEADPLAAGGVGPNRWRASLFFQEAAARPRPDAGPPPPLFHPDGINIMLAHSYLDVARTLAACDAAMRVVVRAMERGTVREQIVGDPIDPAPPWRVTR